MTSANHLDLLRFTNTYITDYVKFSDAKAGAITGAAGLALVALGKVGALHSAVTRTPWTCDWLSVEIPMILCGGALLAAAICALLSLIPRTDSLRVSLFSFPDIAKMEVETYAESMKTADDDLLNLHLCAQNKNLSVILTVKFVHQRRAVISFMISLMLLAYLALRLL